MGEVQLEILRELLQTRFGFSVTFGDCEVLYRETIEEPVHACGHFEPLRHYAEAHFLLSPGERGSGIAFESACSTDVLAKNWQNLIRTHVFEKEHKGVLLGALGIYQPLADWAGAGATVPLTGFGNTLADGVRRAVAEKGALGAFTGGFTAAAGGIAAAVFFAFAAALICKPKEKK